MRVLGFLRESSKAKMDAVQYYRTFAPLYELHRHNNGIEAQCIGPEEQAKATDEELAGRDIYTMCRMYGQDYQPFLDKVHEGGGLVVLDSDDDLTETHKMVSGHGDIFREILGAVDYVACSTQPLADLFDQYTNSAPVVLKNCVDVDWMQTTAANGKRLIDGLTLGFTGSPTHWGDWRVPAVPFARIGKDHPDVTLILHGECPRYMKYAGENASLLQLGGVPFSLYPVLLNQFDIVLCSVDSRDRFNDGKSAVKALECMALGIVPICSRFGPYMELQEAGAPVVIVDVDSQDGWYEVMQDLVTDADFREHLASQGPQWVRQNRDMTVSGYKQWESFYKDIVDETAD